MRITIYRIWIDTQAGTIDEAWALAVVPARQGEQQIVSGITTVTRTDVLPDHLAFGHRIVHHLARLGTAGCETTGEH